MYLSTVLDAITEADLQSLKENQVSEGKLIEYKQCLPGNDDKSKKEFLADITSFANAAGGHLFFGIQEEDGIPKVLCGLNDINPDAEILRLENMIRDSVEPRIHGLAIRPISLENAETIIVIYIPNSWSKPHAVNFQRHWRFYSRNSAGKYQLDVGELRTAFTLSATTWSQIRAFRADRLGRIIAGEAPVQLEDSAKVVLHMVPVSVSDPSMRVDLSSVANESWRLQPICAADSTPRYNFDGFLTCAPPSENHLKRTYVQIFRNGSLEAVDTGLLDGKLRESNLPRIPNPDFEKEIIRKISEYLSIQRRLGVAPPLFIMLSVLGVNGYVIPFRDYLGIALSQPVDRKDLILPEIMLEDFEYDIAGEMKLAFDMIWNSTGQPRSRNYDEMGKWAPQKW